VLHPHRYADETPRAQRVSRACGAARARGIGGARSWRLRAGIRLAVDVGSARIGVARCDPGGLLASPLTTIRRGDGDVDSLASLAAGEGAIEVIVGLPTGLSGREGAAAAQARAFAAALAARLAPLPVRMVDERFTTVIAHDALRQGGRGSRARRPVVDQAAAALILQGALDSERMTGEPAGELVGSASGAGG
jgi:putative holliday junction resolvase